MNKRDYCKMARWFHILAHPVRLQILDELLEEDRCVYDLQTALRRPQPYISQQLGMLRACGIIECCRKGQFRYYRLSDPAVKQVLQWVREQ